MKKILGLDLGTNSIGWAVISADDTNENRKLIGIESAGSRIIPMDAAVLGDFDKGNSISQTAERTKLRGARRLRERNLLRRERLLRVLDLIGFLPDHFSKEIDRFGKFKANGEPKIAWVKNDDNTYEFLFQSSFTEMIHDFRNNQPHLFQVKENGEETKIPYDWTIYYLRKKALGEKISKEELAWLLLHFNQKRGYYQLRGEEEEELHNKLVEFYALKVVSVEASGEKKGKDTWYNVQLENGWIYRRTSSVELDWVGKIKEFIVTTDLDENGTPKIDKDGNVKRSFRAPKEDDWNLRKKKTEYEIDHTNKTVGAFIYDSLLEKPNQKINGQLIRTIERKYYKAELKLILEAQKQFHEELRNQELYERCLSELYPSNESHRENVVDRDFSYLFVDDIIFYQRPLKSKKSLISNCPYEERKDKDGNVYPVKCISKSHPLFQEFRLWQFLSNLRIYAREKEINGRLTADVDVTVEFIKSEEDYVVLFEWLRNRKEIDQNVLLGSYFKLKKPRGKDTTYPYRWNYVDDKKYPCCETHAQFIASLERAEVDVEFLSPENEEALWHILYSIEDKYEITKALKSFSVKHHLTDKFVEEFCKFPPFKKDYGAYSAKAIKKLLPLMRMGKYWSEERICPKTKTRIDKLITGEYDDDIRTRVRQKAINLSEITHFRALPLWLACYIVYDRHSEAKDLQKWNTSADIDAYLKTFKQHSLRNPIVEQVITETLRTVRDIWLQHQRIDEIHIELGREMKNPADRRAQMSLKMNENENTNLRIKAMLTEFMNDEYAIDGVRPYSPGQQDILRIYEEYAVSNLKDDDQDFEFISNVSKVSNPSKSDIYKYKLWLEQKYRSPYTGEIIQLSKLFTPAYEIEHIIPQSRYFDDSLSNKIICESEVNKLKDNQLGYEFIKNHHGEKLVLTHGKIVEIFSAEAYEKFVKDHYSRNKAKLRKLLMEDIPDGFIDRQLNDSRYISKVVKELLSNIVREQEEQEAISKNVITCTGGITDRLKKDWGMGSVWNSIILPRFERLNHLTGTSRFTTVSREGHVIPDMPIELQKGFSKKRIDHRHHAMDAIVIACTSREHINLLNNEAAKSNNRANRYALSKKLRRYEKIQIERNGVRSEIDVAKEFIKPWDNFLPDVQSVLDNIVVSYKQNLRVINKTSNYYQHFENAKKVTLRQTKGESWAIRKPMHKDTVFGEVNLRLEKSVLLKDAIKRPNSIVNKELKRKVLQLLNSGMDAKAIKKYFEDHAEVWSDVNLAKIPIFYFSKDTSERFFATRKPLDTSFDQKKIFGSVSDTAIQKILIQHLKAKDNNPDLAFSPDGIDEMNKNIKTLNDQVPHQPIYKVRVYEKAEKFAVGQVGNKGAKFVEAAKGTNLFFVVYESEMVDKESGEIIKKRNYSTIPLNVVIDRQKKGLPIAPHDEQNNPPLFVLSPNDLVYVPTKEELQVGINIIDRRRIYRMASGTGYQAHFVPASIAFPIVQTIELGSNNKAERSWERIMIKEVCLPLKVDRLGRIKLMLE